MLFGLLAAAHKLMRIAQLVIKLHHKGVDKIIIDDISKLVNDVHNAIDHHHTKAGLKNDQDHEEAK